MIFVCIFSFLYTLESYQLESVYLKYYLLKKKYFPDLCDSIGWVSSHKAKGRPFDLWSGHVPGLQVQSQPVFERGNRSTFFSHFDVSLTFVVHPFPISLKINNWIKSNLEKTNRVSVSKTNKFSHPSFMFTCWCVTVSWQLLSCAFQLVLQLLIGCNFPFICTHRCRRKTAGNHQGLRRGESLKH